MIPSLLQGSNCTFISYGPNGAGKSFTVFGEDESFTPGDFQEDDDHSRLGYLLEIEY